MPKQFDMLLTLYLTSLAKNLALRHPGVKLCGNMSQFSFYVPEKMTCTPQEWLALWSRWYEANTDYEPEYKELIAKSDSLSAEDVRRVGKWKDGAATEARWKPNVASVAYLIWEQAAEEQPKCPSRDGIKAFLEDWSERTCNYVFPTKSDEKRFGLSRASTLLHFVSGGRFPIFDSRVRTAIGRLLGSRKPQYAVDKYLNSFLPAFNDLAQECGCVTIEALRELDKALFSYGAMDDGEFSKLKAASQTTPVPRK